MAVTSTFPWGAKARDLNDLGDGSNLACGA